MLFLSVKRRFAVCAVPVLGMLAAMGVSYAQSSGSGSGVEQSTGSQQSTKRFVDGIAAVVNKQVITLFQLEQELKAAQAQLAMQNIQAPDDDTLRRQVLQRMITEELIEQEARRLNIAVNDSQLDQAIANISQRNNMSESQLRAEIEKSGVSWEYYRQSLRQEILTDLVRQREVDSRIMISDNEVDAFLRSLSVTGGFTGGGQAAPASQGQSSSSAQASPMQPLGLAQILVQVPESASPAQVQEYRREAQDALARIKAGEDFAAVAAAVSDGPGALEGGDMGVRPAQGWPDLFMQAVQGLSANEVSDIIRSGNGFHILKVTTRGQEPQQSAQRQGPPPDANPQRNDMAAVFQSEGPMMVTQTRVRHILIKIDQGTTDERARTRLEDIRQRVLAGEDFGDMARRYSEDASAPLGGELGWLSPGETVPPFEQAMDNLQPGEVSEPVRTPFGWHLITVDERRTEDMEEEFKRMRAREILFERQVEPAFDDWLSQVRSQAYIDNRLDPRGNQLNRN